MLQSLASYQGPSFFQTHHLKHLKELRFSHSHIGRSKHTVSSFQKLRHLSLLALGIGLTHKQLHAVLQNVQHLPRLSALELDMSALGVKEGYFVDMYNLLAQVSQSQKHPALNVLQGLNALMHHPRAFPQLTCLKVTFNVRSTISLSDFSKYLGFDALALIFILTSVTCGLRKDMCRMITFAPLKRHIG